MRRIRTCPINGLANRSTNWLNLLPPRNPAPNWGFRGPENHQADFFSLSRANKRRSRAPPSVRELSVTVSIGGG